MKSAAISAAFIAAGLALIAALYATVYPLHHDVAGGALTGALAVSLGEGFSGYNAYFPPIEKAWYSLAVRLSDATDIGLEPVLVGMTSLAVTASAAFGYRIRQVTSGAEPPFFAVSFLFLLFSPVVFLNIFGLREHLVVLGLWPYLVLRASKDTDRKVSLPARALIGLWMGAALLFKYIYCLVVLLVEVADAIAQRSLRRLFRAENLVAAAIVAGYLMVWLGFNPAQRETISMIRASIEAYTVDPARAVNEGLLRIGAGLFLLAVAHRLGAPPRLNLIGAAAVLATLAVAWVQQRWYSHHLFPVALAFVFWWWLVAPWLTRSLHVVLLAALAYLAYADHREGRYFTAQVDRLEDVLDDAGISLDDRRVALLSQQLMPFNQVLLADGGLRWTPTPNIAYVSAELLPFDLPENAGKATPPITLASPGSKLLHGQLLRLWKDHPPDYLILDHTSRWPLRHVKLDWKAGFASDPDFMAVFGEYDLVLRHEEPILSFELYARRP